MKHHIRYSLVDPSGNITLLVESPVPAARRPAVAARLMELEPETEQVGFLSSAENADIAMDMAGGEFCGNATMSAAVLYAMREDIRNGLVAVRASGADAPVAVSVAMREDGGYTGTVEMPRPLSVSEEPLPDESSLPVVRFAGIAHVVLERAPDRGLAETLAPSWCRYLGADALGMMFLDRTRGTLTPLVYVPSARTLCWEHSCASGTAAVGAYLAKTTGSPASLSLRQPGGTLVIDAAPDGALRLEGTVKLLKRDAASI